MSDDEPVVKDQRPAQNPEIVDPHHVEAAFIDWVVSIGAFEGVANIVLGTTDNVFTSANGAPYRVTVAARLRINRPTVMLLHDHLGRMLGYPPTVDERPPEQPPPPKNQLN